MPLWKHIWAEMNGFWTFCFERRVFSFCICHYTYINFYFIYYIFRWGNHTFTGHNSPLYARPDELAEDSPGYQMNTDFSIRYWMSQGASPQQILLGMGAYGRGFNLVDGSNHGLYAPASSGIDPGMYTSARGFWGYNEFCEKMRTEHSQWTTVRVSTKGFFFLFLPKNSPTIFYYLAKVNFGFQNFFMLLLTLL